MEDFACKDFNSEGDDESELIEDVRKAPLNKLPTGSATAQSSCTDNLSLYPLKNDTDLYCEFLEVAFQQILFHRGIYPKEIFNAYKKYHVTVHMSIFPELTQYLLNIIKELKPLINKNKIKQVDLSVLQDDKVMEKFVFELGIPQHCIHEREEMLFTELEVSLRECLLRIATFNAPLPHDPTNTSFEILAHVDSSSAMELLFDDESPVKWVSDDSSSVTSSKLHPLKSIKHSPFMKLQLYVLK